MEKQASRHHVPKSIYINRDLSWIEFNYRVMEEARDPKTPLLERAKFLSIVSTNLDEFMSVRVAGVKDQIKAGFNKVDFSGYTPERLFSRIVKKTKHMVAKQYAIYKEVFRELGKEGIHFVDYDELNSTQQRQTENYYHEIIFPVLTPMAVDQSRPFPLVHTLGVYLAILLKKDAEREEDEPYFAIVQVPSILPRFVQIPTRSNSKKKEYLLLEQIIERHIGSLFSGYTPTAVHAFRLTRNADMTLDEEGAEDLLEEIEKELRNRKWGMPVRLEVQKGIHPYSLELLKEEFEITDNVVEISGPLDLSYLMKFSSAIPDFDILRYPKHTPVYPREFAEADDLFEVLRQRDVLVYHPYESFEAVTDFLEQAAHDPNVMAIKMTLYRVSGNSRLIQSLAEAAEEGKQVTVVVELKARFDEERNIAWAKKLEKAGCHVVYGLVGLKTHAKIMLVIRQENNSLRRYVHVGTGNYNDNTAKLYTDLGLFTSNPGIGEDASALFNEITGYSSPYDWKAFAVAPLSLKDRLFERIRREKSNAAEGKPARIIAKMNSLSNQWMVDELYAASRAGVKIDLIIRGVCCLKPGVPELSENIRVISIVDQFLEHSRIFYFENGAKPEVWLSSADWMTRNLTRRIELMCPVYDATLRRMLINILHISLEDNVRARQLQSSGIYTPVKNDLPEYRSQFKFMEIARWKEDPGFY